MVAVPCLMGIDVATAPLASAVRPSGERWTVPNDAAGIATLVEQGQALPPTLSVLAAPGGLERAATATLDARALAYCADVIRPTPRPLPAAQTQELRAL